VLSAVSVVPFSRAAEPFLKKGDVIALVGGEDMVVAGELGYLELLLTRALPDYHLRFRNLAWEGDTVFEQRRDLNFPPLEAQLDQVGATVVICQFGQMESVGAASGWNGDNQGHHREVTRKKADGEFIPAYEKLVARVLAGGKRRVFIVGPLPQQHKVGYQEQKDGYSDLHMNAYVYGEAVQEMAARYQWFQLDTERITSQFDSYWYPHSPNNSVAPPQPQPTHKDNRLNDRGHQMFAEWIVRRIQERLARDYNWPEITGVSIREIPLEEKLLALIRAKNRLWFDYWRVQNWAFLAGDRTEQPSSRDHRDPTKRWFPAEREEFLPLIAAKELEIDALAAQLAKP
jgi:hypothetical protein